MLPSKALLGCGNRIGNGTSHATQSWRDNAGYTADFGTTAAEIVNVSVNNVNFGNVDSVTVSEGDTVTFTVQSVVATDETVAPVVYVGDDAGALPTDGGGDPVNAFGVGGDKTFVTAIDIEADQDEGTNPTGTEHTATVQVLDGADEDLVLEGAQIDVIVAPAGSLNYDAVPAAQVIEQDTISTDGDGVAEFTYTGPDEDREDVIYFRWQAAGDFEHFEDVFDEIVKTWVELTGSPRL